jgi:hypothetical protein
MYNVAHVLSPAMQAALAKYFHDLNPKPVGGAPQELVAAGKKSTRRAFLTLMYLHALPVTVQKLKVMENFPVWQGSCMTTSLTNW